MERSVLPPAATSETVGKKATAICSVRPISQVPKSPAAIYRLTDLGAANLHELSTNAIKYGAWKSDCTGSVSVEWGADRNRLWVSWREQGIQIPAGPSRRGFGSKLLNASFRGMTIEHELHGGGVKCTVIMEAL
jgi:anti-sigma regulatory factor (Ser/Thr protein kinase)